MDEQEADGPGGYSGVHENERSRFVIDPVLVKRIRKLLETTDLQERMAAIRLKDFTGRSPSVIYRYLREKLVYFPFETTFTRPYNIDRFPVYRGRLNIDLHQENIFLARTFSYPNPVFCSSNGRANVAKFPVFYCSDNAGTAVAELRPKVGDTVFLSEWVIRCHRSTEQATMFPPTIETGNPWIKIATNLRRGRVSFYEEHFGKEVTDRVDQIFSFFGDLFLNEGPPYAVTSSLAFNFLYKRLVDYLIYPSFVTRAGSCNLAFHPNFVDEFFQIDRVFNLYVDKTDQDGAVVRVVGVAEYWKNILAWRLPYVDEDLPSMSSLLGDGISVP